MRSGEYERRVNAVMDFVRANLTEDLKLERLAEIAHFSPFHFHRIFSATTGETIGSFARRARLERATYLMKSSPSRSLTAIAMDAGFTSPSDFSRAFRAAYGIAPSAWDRVRRLPDADRPVQPEGLGRFGVPDPPLDVVVRQRPEIRMAYVRVRGPFDGSALEDGYTALRSWMDAQSIDWRSRHLYGVSWDNYDTTPLDQVVFDLGFSVPATIGPGPDGAGGIGGIHSFPTVRAAEVHSRGPMLRIAQAWDLLYLGWLPESGYEPADLPAVKRFRRRPDETGWDLWDVDCSLAIRRLRT